MEVRFAVCYGELNERFWSQFDTLLTVVQAISGSLALAGVFVPGGALTALAGVVLAAISGVQAGLKPRERSIAFRDARRQFEDLNMDAARLDLATLDRRLETLRRDAPRGFQSLLRPAEHQALRQHGYPGLTLTRWERFMCFCA
ncbi:hypothetical protein QTH91_04670 [Variovorax dokdonensis]|uniref:SMODS and SLOG-associating 2TM effector domain-containing protein n=1 Tax=Variovorax dokdonensis TaxID=344883 RepID=A0ABT7N749_9BURK|nr:hypothetical protein [Variovorax dokdonensis]MDM0043768.1 hypothetical protein [Variovorax dokdonensis]